MNQAMQQTENNAVFNWPIALERLNNNKEAALEYTQLLHTMLQDIIPVISRAFKENDHALFERELHKLNGSLCYSGALQLKEDVDLLETASKQKEHQTLQAHMPHFIDHATALEKALDSFLNTTNT
jgi:HPt (histidine-containing phosphotransfer) domain-containing protein